MFFLLGPAMFIFSFFFLWYNEKAHYLSGKMKKNKNQSFKNETLLEKMCAY
jgi:hypothetical protein